MRDVLWSYKQRRNEQMRVLVSCEYSGRVRDAFLARGHDAMSCDLLPTDVEGPHYQGSVLDILGDEWDLMIAHPPCTHLAVSGARHFAAKRQKDLHFQAKAALVARLAELTGETEETFESLEKATKHSLEVLVKALEAV
jgi:hypothetical protein